MGPRRFRQIATAGRQPSSHRWAPSSRPCSDAFIPTRLELLVSIVKSGWIFQFSVSIGVYAGYTGRLFSDNCYRVDNNSSSCITSLVHGGRHEPVWKYTSHMGTNQQNSPIKYQLHTTAILSKRLSNTHHTRATVTPASSVALGGRVGRRGRGGGGADRRGTRAQPTPPTAQHVLVRRGCRSPPAAGDATALGAGVRTAAGGAATSAGAEEIQGSSGLAVTGVQRSGAGRLPG